MRNKLLYAKRLLEGIALADFSRISQSADELTLRDATGRVSVIAKDKVKSRRPLQGSIMPEGLADPMTLDDFASLLAFLQSLKTTSH